MEGISYIIAYFSVDNSVEVVPVNWLSSDSKFVYFPPGGTKNFKKLVKKSSPYESDWPLFECSIYGKYATYGEARLHLKDAEVASGLSDAGKNKPKPTPKPVLPNHPLSLDEPSQTASSKSASPIHSDINPVTETAVVIAEVGSDVSQNQELINNTTMKNVINQNGSQTSQSEQLLNITPGDSNLGIAESSHSFVLAGQNIEFVPTVNLPCNTIEIHQCDSCTFMKKDVLAKLKKLELALEQQGELLNEIALKLSRADTEPESKFNFPVSKFPILSLEGVEELEKTVNDNGDAKKELVRFLLSCGGGTTQAAVENMCRSLIADDVMILHCYVGQGYSKKKAFAGYTSILQCMLDSLKKNAMLKSFDATMDSLKDHIIKEFKKSSDRVRQRKARDELPKKTKGDTLPGATK